MQPDCHFENRDILLFVRTKAGLRSPQEHELMQVVFTRLTRENVFCIPGEKHQIRFGETPYAWENGAAIRIRIQTWGHQTNFGALDCGQAISEALTDAGGRFPEGVLVLEIGGGIFEDPHGGLASRFCDAVGFDGYTTIKNPQRDVREKENRRFTTVMVKSKQNDPSYRTRIDELRDSVRGRCYPVFDLTDGQVFIIDSKDAGSITAAMTSQRSTHQLRRFSHWAIVDGSGVTRSSDGDEAVWQEIETGR
jgi:hypothetical protein